VTSGEDNPARRHSVAAVPDLISDPIAKAEAEARNGLLQFDLGLQIIEDALGKGKDFRWRPSIIQALHREALRGVSEFAGNWRPGGVGIEGSRHEPVGAHLVPESIEDLCEHLNSNMEEMTAIQLAAYAMWRLNWIHPFSDGNGRTSRIFSYVVLCVKLRFVLRGARTIPDQIVENRKPYFDALEAADSAWKSGVLDTSSMESLLERLLAIQLTDVFERATGKRSPEK
jgi:Fic family protein